MPTYEYECTKCAFVFEEFQSISAPKRQRCPRCRGKVERLISGGTGIVFRGKGFYATDSRTMPARPRAGESEKTAASDSASADSTASEPAKTAAKSTTPDSTSAS